MAGRAPEEIVRIPAVRQGWRDVTFLHWPYRPDVIQNRLPEGLSVDTFDGAAWVTITPFLVTGMRVGPFPAIPGISQHPETNVRTYVRGPDGRDGLWFLTLEVDSLLTVASARPLLGVPYQWAAMRIDERDGAIRYRSERRRGTAGHDITIRSSTPVGPGDELAHWLTGRWRAWQHLRAGWATVAVQHQTWPLSAGRVVSMQESLLAATGLPQPDEEPVVHTASGVQARLGSPRLLSRPAATAART